MKCTYELDVTNLIGRYSSVMKTGFSKKNYHFFIYSILPWRQLFL